MTVLPSGAAAAKPLRIPVARIVFVLGAREGVPMAKEGRRWTMDDAWWLDPPTINEPDPPHLDDGGAAEAGAPAAPQTLWADDAGAWADEPLTSPDIGEDRPPPRAATDSSKEA